MSDVHQQQMIFVVGSSRSGTTMMGRVLGKHPDVFTFKELHFFEQLWDPSQGISPLSREQAIHLTGKLLTIERDGYYLHRDPAEYADEAAAVIGRITGKLTPPAVFAALLGYEAQRHGKAIACDQTPRNVFYLREILELYPQARVVHMVRDPRDVLLSQKRMWRRRQLAGKEKHRIPLFQVARLWSNYHPITISMLWDAATAAGDRQADHPRVAQLKFEDLVANPAQQLQQLCQRIGLTYDPAMLDVPKVGSSHRTDAPASTGIDPAMAGRWRNDQNNLADLAICQRIIRQRRQAHGYDHDAPAPASTIAVLSLLLLWPVKTAAAFGLNFRRVRNIPTAIRRRLGK